MKKLFSLLLCALMLFSFASCSSTQTTEASEEPSAEPSAESTTEPSADPEPTDAAADPAVPTNTDASVGDPAIEGEGIDAEGPSYELKCDASLFSCTAEENRDTYALLDGTANASLTVEYLVADAVEAYEAEHLGDDATTATIGSESYPVTCRHTVTTGEDGTTTSTSLYIAQLSTGDKLAITTVSVDGAHETELADMLASLLLH